MPSLDEILVKAGEAQVIMSQLDLANGFYQHMVDKSSRDKTTFGSPFGKFRFRRMPFGLKNATVYFQRMFEKALRSCRNICTPYIDDVLILSKRPEYHIEHVKVLIALREAELTAKPEKYEWGTEYLTYLGHRVGREQVAVPETRADVMASYKKPQSQKNMRAF